MKQTHVLIFCAIVLVGGVVYWVMTQNNTTEPNNVTIEPKIEPVIDNYIGLTEAEAEALAMQNGAPFRVVERDGEMLPTTRDYRPGRINVTVDANVVTFFEVEGLGMEEEEDIVDSSEHDVIIGMTLAEAEAYAVDSNVRNCLKSPAILIRYDVS